MQCASGKTPRGPARIPSAPATSPHTTAGNVQRRRGLSAPPVCCHTFSGPAYLRLSDENPTSPDRGSCRPKPALTVHQLRQAVAAQAPKPTATRLLQTGHDRSPTWHRNRRCCHRRPGRGDAQGLGNAQHPSTRLMPGPRVAPGSRLRDARRNACTSKLAPATSDRRPRYAISRYCLIFSPLADRCRGSHWCCHRCSPLGLGHRRDEGRALPRLGSGRMPFSSTLPKRFLRRRRRRRRKRQ